MEDHMGRIGELQTRIRAEHERLELLGSGDAGYPAAVRRVLDAAAELLDLEDRLPVLLDEPRHRVSVWVVRVSGALGAGFAGALVVVTLLGHLSRWWNLVLVPLLGIGLAVTFARVRPAGDHHREQRTGAALAGVGMVLGGLVVLGVLPGWGLVVAVGALVGGLALVFGGPARFLGETSGDRSRPASPRTPSLTAADTGEIPVVIDLDAGRPGPGDRSGPATAGAKDSGRPRQPHRRGAIWPFPGGRDRR